MPVSEMPIPLVVLVIIAIFSLAVIMGIFIPGASAAPGKIANLPFFGSAPQDDSGSLELGHKALHVKIKPFKAGVVSDDELQIYEFHLTDQGALGNEHYSDKSMDDRGGIDQYFDIKKWKDNKCVLFTTSFDNTPSPIIWKTTDPLDKNYIYYIESGTIISSDITKNLDLKSAIDGRYERGCETIKCGDFNTGDYTVCATECTIWPWWECKDAYFFECDEKATNNVIEQKFGTGEDHCNQYTEGCPSNGCCSLLKSNPTENYKLAGGLMCGYSENEVASAKWWVCAPQNRGASVYTKMKGEPNAIQYRCEDKTSGTETFYEWTATANQGIGLENAQIKYEFGYVTDDHTDLKFYVANQNSVPMKDVSVTAKVTNTDADCKGAGGLTENDCMELVADKNKDTAWGEVAIGKPYSSEGLSCSTFKGDFCYKAKTFDVKIDYKISENNADVSKTANFKIECNADIGREAWQICDSTGSAQVPSTAKSYDIGASFSEICNSKKYDIKYEGAPPDSVLLEIKENGLVVKQGIDSRWIIKKGAPAIIGNNLKLTLYDAGATSPYTAKISAECV